MNFLEIVASVVFIQILVIVIGYGSHFFKLATDKDYKENHKIKNEIKKKLNIVIENLALVQNKNEFYDIIFDPYIDINYKSNSLEEKKDMDDFDDEKNIVNIISDSVIISRENYLKDTLNDLKEKNIEPIRINDYINCFNLIDKKFDGVFEILELKKQIKLELIKNNYNSHKEI